MIEQVPSRPPAGRRVDPIRFEVIRNALTAAVDEMGVALQRSAFSSNIKTRGDFSCMFFDRQMRAVAQAFTQPIHLGGLFHLVPTVLRHYGTEKLGPGDGLLVNHPFLGGVHLNDVTLISPVHVEGEVFGYLASLAHHVDVGGGAPASIGAFREIYQEGIVIPPVRLVKGGVVDEDIFQFLLANVRAKHETSGDLGAQIAANKLGERRIRELADKYGPRLLDECMEDLLAYTADRTRREIATLPRGSYRAEGFLDDDGFTDEPIRLAAQLVIDEAGITFDLSGTSPQRRAPMNSTFAQTYSSCAYFLRCLTDPDLPMNAGFYEAIRVIAPEGTVANAVHPAAVVGGWEVSVRWIDVFLKAISEALPDRVCAGGKSMQCHAGFGGFDPRRTRIRGSITASSKRWRAGMAADAGKTGPTPCRPIRRTRRTRPSRRPSSTTRCGSCVTSSLPIPRGRGSSAAGSACGGIMASPTTSRRSRSWPTAASSPLRGSSGVTPGDWRTTP